MFSGNGPSQVVEVKVTLSFAFPRKLLSSGSRALLWDSAVAGTEIRRQGAAHKHSFATAMVSHEFLICRRSLSRIHPALTCLWYTTLKEKHQVLVSPGVLPEEIFSCSDAFSNSHLDLPT